MKKLFFILPTLFLFIGCGASDDDSHRDRSMKIGESYSVSTADKIIKSTKDTHIKITHIDGETTSSVELIDGNATITHPKQK